MRTFQATYNRLTREEKVDLLSSTIMDELVKTAADRRERRADVERVKIVLKRGTSIFQYGHERVGA